MKVPFSTPVIFSAPAKINLFLHILKRRADNYHEIQTLFQFLNFCDTLVFQVRADTQIQVHTDWDIPMEQNLVFKAACTLQQTSQSSWGIDIFLQKKIPMGSGLGGASSDAATTLVALNHLWEIQWSTAQLAQLGQKLGADIPIFIQGHTSWAEGIGEQLTPMNWSEVWYLVIIPPVHISTATIFSHSQLTRNTPRSTISDLQHYAHTMHNDFEPLVRQLYPVVDQAFIWLAQWGKPRLTGSGSALFTPFLDESTAQQALEQLPNNYKGFIATGKNRSPLLTELDNIWQ